MWDGFRLCIILAVTNCESGVYKSYINSSTIFFLCRRNSLTNLHTRKDKIQNWKFLSEAHVWVSKNKSSKILRNEKGNAWFNLTVRKKRAWTIIQCGVILQGVAYKPLITEIGGCGETQQCNVYWQWLPKWEML